MFPTKCQGQSNRMGHPVISCVYQNLDFSIGFATTIWIFTVAPLLRFLCLINSFHKRYLSCGNITCPIYCLSISYYFALSPSSPLYFALFLSISICFVLFRQSLVPQKGPHGIHISQIAISLQKHTMLWHLTHAL